METRNKVIAFDFEKQAATLDHHIYYSVGLILKHLNFMIVTLACSQ